MRKFNITLNGKTYEVLVEEVDPDSAPIPVKTETKSDINAFSDVGSVRIYAPVSGTIVNISVAVGDTVKTGDVICTLEAMKVESIITAPADGKIVTVNVLKGIQVTGGCLLATMN